MTRPAYNERIQWSPNYNSRALGPIDYGAIHTQQGNGTAASLANYLGNPAAEVSYHYTVDNARNVVACVDTDDASWSVGNANNRCVNVCFAGSFAEWSRQQWLDNMGNAIEIAAWLQVSDALKYGFDPVVRSWDDLKAGKTGLTDHRGINMGVLRSPGHTDCGDFFPWDVYIGHVNRFVAEIKNPPPAPPKTTAIEDSRAANTWLGDKTMPERERPLPDGDGRIATYQNGNIYWSPSTKAQAIPALFLPKYAELKWEKGVLGYPVANQLVLQPYTRSNGNTIDGGTVQAFEKGTLYARTPDRGSPVYAVRGAIRDHYRVVGYEHTLGWPLEDEKPWGDDKVGGQKQAFQFGTIYWIRQGGSAIAFDDRGNPLGSSK